MVANLINTKKDREEFFIANRCVIRRLNKSFSGSFIYVEWFVEHPGAMGKEWSTLCDDSDFKLLFTKGERFLS